MSMGCCGGLARSKAPGAVHIRTTRNTPAPTQLLMSVLLPSVDPPGTPIQRSRPHALQLTQLMPPMTGSRSHKPGLCCSRCDVVDIPCGGMARADAQRKQPSRHRQSTSFITASAPRQAARAISKSGSGLASLIGFSLSNPKTHASSVTNNTPAAACSRIRSCHQQTCLLSLKPRRHSFVGGCRHPSQQHNNDMNKDPEPPSPHRYRPY